MIGGLAMLRRFTPPRPLVAGVIATVGFALPPGAIALGLPTGWIAAAALGTGVGTAVNSAIMATVEQRLIPPRALARVSSYVVVGAFGMGPVGLAAAGVLGTHIGLTTVLGCGAAWQILSCLLLLALPDIRGLRAEGLAAVVKGPAPRLTGK